MLLLLPPSSHYPHHIHIDHHHIHCSEWRWLLLVPLLALPGFGPWIGAAQTSEREATPQLTILMLLMRLILHRRRRRHCSFRETTLRIEEGGLPGLASPWK
jgi:hypothetical protein